MPVTFPNVYSDPIITATRDEVDALSPVALPASPPARTTTPKQDPSYDIAERVTDISGLTPVPAAAFKESFPEIDETTDRGSDPYSNNGIPSQDSFLKNQG